MEPAEEAKEATEEKIGSNEKAGSESSPPKDIQYKPGQYLSLTSPPLSIPEPPQGLTLPSPPCSITELYCDDELSPDLSYHNTHLDLSPLDCPLPLHHEDPLLTQKVLLPFSVPSILQGSLQETSLDWSEV